MAYCQIVSVLPIIIMFGFFLVKVLDPALYLQLVQEDSILEWSQFVLLILIGMSYIQIYHRERKLIYSYISIVFFFWGLEEISWFQSLLMFETPNWFLEHNKQQELNLHNLSPIHLMLPMIYFFTGCSLSFGNIVLELLDFFGIKLSSRNLLNNFLPNRRYIFYFLPVVLVYGIFIFISPHNGGFLIWRDQEPVELLLILGIFSHIQSINGLKMSCRFWPGSIVRINRRRNNTPA